jgi:hypothetical protein
MVSMHNLQAYSTVSKLILESRLEIGIKRNAHLGNLGRTAYGIWILSGQVSIPTLFSTSTSFFRLLLFLLVVHLAWCTWRIISRERAYDDTGLPPLCQIFDGRGVCRLAFTS